MAMFSFFKELLARYNLSATKISWDDASRGAVNGKLSCWGSNITDTCVRGADGTAYWNMRPDNFADRRCYLSAKQLGLVASKKNGSVDDGPMAMTLARYIAHFNELNAYQTCSLVSVPPEMPIAVRFQTVFIPYSTSPLELTAEAFNYQALTKNPRNMTLLCTAQDTTARPDQSGKFRLFHHKLEDGIVKDAWLSAEATEVAIGTKPNESEAEACAMVEANKAMAAPIGCSAMGSTFSSVMVVQIPLKQKVVEASLGDDLVYRSARKTRGVQPKSCDARMSIGSSAGVADVTSREFECAGEAPTATIVFYCMFSGTEPTEQDVVAAAERINMLYDTAKTSKTLFDELAEGKIAELSPGTKRKCEEAAVAKSNMPRNFVTHAPDGSEIEDMRN